MSNSEVDIAGLDKKEVLKQLWLGSKPATFFVMSGIEPPNYDPKEAENAIKRENIDYLCGRAIKCGIYGNKLINYRYDSYNGEGTMQKAVDLVREQKKKNWWWWFLNWRFLNIWYYK